MYYVSTSRSDILLFIKHNLALINFKLGMLTSLDRDESRKKFSGSRKKFLYEKFLDPKF